MRCHQCQAEVDDTAAICPSCDAILDPSFLGDEGGYEEDHDKPLRRTDTPAGGMDAVDYEPEDAYDGDDVPLAGEAQGSTRILQLDPEREKETRIVAISDLKKGKKGGGESAALAARRRAELKRLEKEEASADIWGQVAIQFRRLRTIDKIPLVAMLMLFVGPFLPWSTVKGKGAISGIELKGLWTAVLAIGAVATFWLRIQLRMTLLVLLQIALVAGACIVPGLLLKQGGQALAAGVYLTLFAGLAAAVTSLIGAVRA